jgi:hypothetical protein
MGVITQLATEMEALTAVSEPDPKTFAKMKVLLTCGAYFLRKFQEEEDRQYHNVPVLRGFFR